MSRVTEQLMGNAVHHSIRLMETYAEAYRIRYAMAIGDDYVCGPAWAKILSGLHSLLDGELGPYDAGLLSKAVHDMADRNGIDLEDH